MAYYEHLPIYKKAMETAVYFEKIVRNFSRYNKYNLGAEMRTKSRDIVKLIIKANLSRNKLPLLYDPAGPSPVRWDKLEMPLWLMSFAAYAPKALIFLE